LIVSARFIQDGVVQGGVANDGVPLIDRDLAGNDGGSATVAIIEDLEGHATYRPTSRGLETCLEDMPNALKGRSRLDSTLAPAIIRPFEAAPPSASVDLASA
jgi:hypothetical protein